MKNLIIIVSVITVLGFLAFVFYNANSSSKKSNTTMIEQPIAADTQNNSMEDDSTLQQPIATPTEAHTSDRGYLPYTQADFDQYDNTRRVLFFHAAWCPTCRVADSEFSTTKTELPEDVILFKVNYDTEDQLKEKYDITYQHTFVQVDSDGNKLNSWNGGGMDELLANLQ